MKDLLPKMIGCMDALFASVGHSSVSYGAMVMQVYAFLLSIDSAIKGMSE